MSFRGSRHREHGGLASNGNIAVYIFFVLFTVWLAFQIWARFGGGPAPAGLDPMVMAALGVAVAGKSVERGQQEQKQKVEVEDTKERVLDLEQLAILKHPDAENKLASRDKERSDRKDKRKLDDDNGKDNTNV